MGLPGWKAPPGRYRGPSGVLRGERLARCQQHLQCLASSVPVSGPGCWTAADLPTRLIEGERGLAG